MKRKAAIIREALNIRLPALSFSEIIRFWITRLHGPEVLYKDILSGDSRAVWFLTTGNPTKAQDALDAIGLVALSQDGAALMKAVVRELSADPLNLPVQASPRTWNGQDILRHVAFFEEGVLASRQLMKGTFPVFDPAKLPRWRAVRQTVRVDGSRPEMALGETASSESVLNTQRAMALTNPAKRLKSRSKG